MPRMNLSSVTVGGEQKPPRIVIYGPDGIGKTTFAVSAPHPIVLRTEDGLATIPVPTFPKAQQYGDAIEALSTLYTEDHGFQTLVIDTLDWLEPMIWSRVALEEGKDHIEDIGYGKGYVKAEEKWTEFFAGLDALRDKGMTVILLAHAEIKRFDAPDASSYDRYQLKLHKSASSLVSEWADVVGFARYEVHTVSQDVGFKKEVTRGVGVGRRLLSVEERPAYHAKNRYQLPPDLDLAWSAFTAACTTSFARLAEARQAAAWTPPAASSTSLPDPAASSSTTSEQPAEEPAPAAVAAAA